MKKYRLVILTALSVMAFVGIGFGLKQTFSPALAEETEVTEVVTEEQIEPSEYEKIKGKVAEVWTNKIEPALWTILGSFSFGTAFTIFFAWKNHNTIKKLEEENKKITNTAKDLLDLSNKLLAAVSENTVLGKEVKEANEKQVKEIAKQISVLSTDTQNLSKLEPIMHEVVSVISTLASNSKDMVANGVSEKLNKILEELKAI